MARYEQLFLSKTVQSDQFKNGVVASLEPQYLGSKKRGGELSLRQIQHTTKKTNGGLERWLSG